MADLSENVRLMEQVSGTAYIELMVNVMREIAREEIAKTDDAPMDHEEAFEDGWLKGKARIEAERDALRAKVAKVENQRDSFYEGEKLAMKATRAAEAECASLKAKVEEAAKKWHAAGAEAQVAELKDLLRYEAYFKEAQGRVAELEKERDALRADLQTTLQTGEHAECASLKARVAELERGPPPTAERQTYATQLEGAIRNIETVAWGRHRDVKIGAAIARAQKLIKPEHTEGEVERGPGGEQAEIIWCGSRCGKPATQLSADEKRNICGEGCTGHPPPHHVHLPPDGDEQAEPEKPDGWEAYAARLEGRIHDIYADGWRSDDPMKELGVPIAAALREIEQRPEIPESLEDLWPRVSTKCSHLWIHPNEDGSFTAFSGWRPEMDSGTGPTIRAALEALLAKLEGACVVCGDPRKGDGTTCGDRRCTGEEHGDG